MEVRKKRFSIQLSVEHSTASLLAGSRKYCPAPQACAAAGKNKQTKKRAVYFNGRFEMPQAHQASWASTRALVYKFSMSYAKGTPCPLPPTLPCFSPGSYCTPLKPNLEKIACWGHKVSLTKMCPENGYLWLLKHRTIKSLSLRENPASLMPQEQLSLHRFFPESRKCFCSLFPPVNCTGCGFSQTILWVWFVY